MINQSRAKVPKRKSPVRHDVRGYRKRNGTGVTSHQKGSGTKSNRTSKKVGRTVGPTRKVRGVRLIKIETLNDLRKINAEYLTESYDFEGDLKGSYAIVTDDSGYVEGDFTIPKDPEMLKLDELPFLDWSGTGRGEVRVYTENKEIPRDVFGKPFLSTGQADAWIEGSSTWDQVIYDEYWDEKERT